MKRIATIALVGAVALFAATAVRAEPAAEIGKRVFEQYQRIEAALATDSIEGVREAAAEIAETVKPCDCTAEEGRASQALVDAARGIDGSDLTSVREQFKALSRALPAYLAVTGFDATQIYYCPMVDAYWLQAKSDGAVLNPYYGKSMQKCGTKVDRIEG